eukprot:scaffold194502_cov39-Tisochrysis_lutea.AAC.1
MSISGWYHAPAEPEDLQNASLQQLQQQQAQAQPLSKGADLLAASQYLPFGPQGDGAGVKGCLVAQ